MMLDCGTKALSVAELKVVLNTLDDDLIVIPNSVGNLLIKRNNEGILNTLAT